MEMTVLKKKLIKIPAMLFRLRLKVQMAWLNIRMNNTEKKPLI